MSNTAAIPEWLQQYLQQQGGAAAPTGVWQNPGQSMSLTHLGTQGFWRPNDSQLMEGNELYNYILGGTGDTGQINRTTKFDGGLTREMLGNTTGFLSNQIGQGFGSQLGGIEDLFNRYGSLGGLGGVAQAGNASAVYRPNGEVQATNGTSLPWGQTNPFNATF